jgi:hypothetical protein
MQELACVVYFKVPSQKMVSGIVVLSDGYQEMIEGVNSENLDDHDLIEDACFFFDDQSNKHDLDGFVSFTRINNILALAVNVDANTEKLITNEWLSYIGKLTNQKCSQLVTIQCDSSEKDEVISKKLISASKVGF